MPDEIILHSSGFDEDQASSIYTEGQLIETYGTQEQEEDFQDFATRTLKRSFSCTRRKLIKFTKRVIPPLEWLPKYTFRENVVGDIVAGLTVGIVHLPQGMAYGLLASLPAVTGLYVSFFPVLVYVFFGTSRHISIGTFAVVSLMIAQVINENVSPCPETGGVSSSAEHNAKETLPHSSTTSGTDNTTSTTEDCESALSRRKIEIAVALAMANGIIQVAMSILRLGIVTTYLSTHLVSGFTCGAAFHVLTSQVPKLLGVSVDRVSGPLALIYTYVDLFKHITTTNWGTVVISVCCILFLAIGKVVNAKIQDRLPIPLPWELAVVIFGTVASYFGHFSIKYGVQIVGNIPTGIQVSLPKASDIGSTMLSGIPIAIVSFATEISLSEMFATKHSYKVDSNQELLAMGFGNIAGSFFSCFPASASLSRSVISEEVGARTQISGFFSSMLILVILLWIGPLFESLPQAALASIIVVNLKGLLKPFDRVPRLWRLNKLDALTWVITWASVVLLGVSLGLGVAVAFQVFTVVLKIQNVKASVMGTVEHRDEYRDVRKYRTEADIYPNVVVFQFPAPIIFANKERFKSELFRAVGVDPTLMTKSRETDELTQNSNLSSSSGSDNEENLPTPTHASNGSFELQNITKNGTGGKRTSLGHARLSSASSSARKIHTTHLILDMSRTSFLDNDGAKAIRAMHSSLTQVDIKFFLASSNNDVRRILAVECEKQRPPFFTSVEKAMEVASGRVAVELDEIGNVLSVNQSTRDTRF